MHYGVLTTSYPRHEGDASGHFVQAEVLRLIAHGHRVTVFAPSDRPEITSGAPEHVGLGGGGAFGWPGVIARLHAAPTGVLGLILFMARARRAVARAECDRLVAHWLLPCAWPLALAFNGPVEAVIHGGDARLFRRLPKALQWRVLDDLWDRQYTLRFVAEALRQDFGALTQHRLYARSRVEPCALEVRRELTRAEARQRLSIGADEFLALVVGRLVPSKRVAHALAVPRAPKQCRWVVLGDGPELSRLRREFPHVAFLGRVDRETVLNWLQAADVLVSASLSEGAPSAIREARALGVRVWAHPAGDIAAWAQHDNGIELLQ